MVPFLFIFAQIKSNMRNKNTIEGPEELFNETLRDLDRVSELSQNDKMFIAHMMFQNFWMALDSIISEDELEPWGKKLDEITEMRITN